MNGCLYLQLSIAASYSSTLLVGRGLASGNDDENQISVLPHYCDLLQVWIRMDLTDRCICLCLVQEESLASLLPDPCASQGTIESTRFNILEKKEATRPAIGRATHDRHE
jgi:hypothetical protein